MIGNVVLSWIIHFRPRVRTALRAGAGRRMSLLGFFGTLLDVVLDIVDTLLEASDALAQAAHQFGYFFAAEKQQHDKAYYKEFTDAKISDK